MLFLAAARQSRCQACESGNRSAQLLFRSVQWGCLLPLACSSVLPRLAPVFYSPSNCNSEICSHFGFFLSCLFQTRLQLNKDWRQRITSTPYYTIVESFSSNLLVLATESLPWLRRIQSWSCLSYWIIFVMRFHPSCYAIPDWSICW